MTKTLPWFWCSAIVTRYTCTSVSERFLAVGQLFIEVTAEAIANKNKIIAIIAEIVLRCMSISDEILFPTHKKYLLEMILQVFEEDKNLTIFRYFIFSRIFL